MIADSQHSPRLTYNAGIIYGRLLRRKGEVVSSEELRLALFVNQETIVSYITQIRKVLGVKIKPVYKKGYILEGE